MSSRVTKIFMSQASLKFCFYLWVILLLLTPVAYIYDYDGFKVDELRSFFFIIAVLYTFALGAYIEIQRTKQPNNKKFSRTLIIISNIVSFILMVLFGLSVVDYVDGNLKLDHIYDPILQLFFLYLLFQSIGDMKNGLNSKETSLPS